MSKAKKFLCFVVVCVVILHSTYAQSTPATKADLEQAIEKATERILSHVDTRIEAVNTRIDAVQLVLSQEIKAVQAVLSQEIKSIKWIVDIILIIGIFFIGSILIPIGITQWRNALHREPRHTHKEQTA